MAAPDARPAQPARLGFRPDIAGLRAVAVGLVVVLHAGVTSVSGGYVGVDVFFVISGFLITSLLIDEVHATDRVSILGFYARRARRILPAACFVIAVTVVVAYLQLGPLIGRTTATDGRWAAAFAANFRFIQQGTDYFASALPPSPLQHYWSLAVEEQFYLVWPTLIFGLVVLGRRATRSNLVLRTGILAVVIGSLFWSIHESTIDRTTAYFSPFTRAWELGAGALIAVFSASIASTPAVLRAIGTWVGLAFIAIAAFTFTANTVFPGYAALLPVVGTVLIIAGGIGTPRGSAGTMLGFKPLQWLGLISFSVYLWHWPVFTIAQERSNAPLSNVARIVCVLITLVLSVASYYAIERPLHTTGVLKAKNPRNTWERSRRALIAGAFVIAVAVGISAITNNRAVTVIDRASAEATNPSPVDGAASPTSALVQTADLEQTLRTRVAEGLALHEVPGDVDPPVLGLANALDPRYVNCMQKERVDTEVKTCVFGAKKASETIVVFGDSHAMQWMPALDLYGQRAGYRVVTVYKAECPAPSVDIFVPPRDQPGGARAPYPQCTEWRASALRYIKSVKPTAVVMAFTQSNTSQSGSSDIGVWTGGLEATLQALRATGARVIEIGNNPYLSQDPALCLSRPNADPSACTGKFTDRPRVDAEAATVRGAGATFIDLAPWFCIDGRCPVIVGKRIVYSNITHLTARYVTDLEPLVAASLRSAGLR